jgi:hypothetical protein
LAAWPYTPAKPVIEIHPLVVGGCCVLQSNTFREIGRGHWNYFIQQFDDALHGGSPLSVSVWRRDLTRKDFIEGVALGPGIALMYVSAATIFGELLLQSILSEPAWPVDFLPR